MSKMDADNQSGHYPIVGRPDVDLSNYLVTIHGRSIIDYEKLKEDNLDLYNEIMRAERAADACDDFEHEEL